MDESRVVVTEKGYGCRIPVDRKGILIKESERNGKMVGEVSVRRGDRIVVATSLRWEIELVVGNIPYIAGDIPSQGVCLLNLQEDEVVTSLYKLKGGGKGSM